MSDFKADYANKFYCLTIEFVASRKIKLQSRYSLLIQLLDSVDFWLMYTLAEASFRARPNAKVLQLLSFLQGQFGHNNYLDLSLDMKPHRISGESLIFLLIRNSLADVKEIESAIEKKVPTTAPVATLKSITSFLWKDGTKFLRGDRALSKYAIKAWGEACKQPSGLTTNADATALADYLSVICQKTLSDCLLDEKPSRGIASNANAMESITKGFKRLDDRNNVRALKLLDFLKNNLPEQIPATNRFPAKLAPPSGSAVPTERRDISRFGEPEFVIFHGPPGTGKTTVAKRYCDKNEKTVLQIHPSYSYEDFVEGLKPVTFSDGELRYELVEGPLKITAHRARQDYPAKILTQMVVTGGDVQLHLPVGYQDKYRLNNVYISPAKNRLSENTYSVENNSLRVPKSDFGTVFPGWPVPPIGTDVFQHIYFLDTSWGQNGHSLILDEINRGNISHILGELIYVLAEEDSDKRHDVTLQYSGELFRWPRNLSLIATMNTADSSTERLDQAIKRRFTLEYVAPSLDVFRTAIGLSYLAVLTEKYAFELAGTKIETLDKLFEWFGSKNRASALSDQINSLLISNQKQYGIIHVRDKLIGHSYLMKVCRRLAKLPEMNLEMRKVALWIEMVKLFCKEISPALMSVFNHNEKTLHSFYKDLCGHESSESPLVELFYETLIEKLLFEKEKVDHVTVTEYMTKHGVRWRVAS